MFNFLDLFDLVDVFKRIAATVSEKRNVKNIAKRNMPRSGRELDIKDNKCKGNDPERSDK